MKSVDGQIELTQAVLNYRFSRLWWVTFAVILAYGCIAWWGERGEFALSLGLGLAMSACTRYLFFTRGKTRLAIWIQLLASIALLSLTSIYDGCSKAPLLWMMPACCIISALFLSRQQWRYFTAVCLACILGVCIGEPYLLSEPAEFNDPRLTFLYQCVTLAALSLFSLITTVSVERMLIRMRAKDNEIERSRKKIEGSLNVKGRFLESMSNNSRVPLRDILEIEGSTHDEDLPQHQRDAFSTIRENSEILVDMLAKISEYANIQSGDYVTERKIFGLSPFFERLRSDWAPRIQAEGFEFQLHTEKIEGESVSADPRAIRRVLDLLIENAMEHSEGRCLCLRVRLKWHLIVVEVQDDGPGIDEEVSQGLFEAFARSDSELVERRRGLGLGLAIAKSLLKLIGASVEAVPAPQRGTIFRAKIPYAAKLQGRETSTSRAA